MRPGDVDICSGCGFYQYRYMPATHLTGCPRETDPDNIHRHRLQCFGRALWNLLRPITGEETLFQQ